MFSRIYSDDWCFGSDLRAFQNGEVSQVKNFGNQLSPISGIRCLWGSIKRQLRVHRTGEI